MICCCNNFNIYTKTKRAQKMMLRNTKKKTNYNKEIIAKKLKRKIIYLKNDHLIFIILVL